MKILLTGSAGRIGSAIYQSLSGHFSVIGIDLVSAPSVDLVGSITDNGFLASLDKDYDAIVHTAALHSPHVGIKTVRDFVATNVVGTKKLAYWALTTNIKQFIFLSSTAVYGYASTNKGVTNWITEESVPRPKTIYHRTKIKAETWLKDFSKELSRKQELAVTVLRMSRCFPEPADKMAVYRLHRGIDVRDVASAHYCALTQNLAGFNLFNISCNTPFKQEQCQRLTKDAAAVIAEVCPQLVKEFHLRGWQLPQTIDRVYDASKAMSLLNWQPNYGFAAVLECLEQQNIQDSYNLRSNSEQPQALQVLPVPNKT